VWGPPAYGRTLWTRYLDVFSGVAIAARVADVEEPSAGSVAASMASVQFCPLPSYAGLSGVISRLDGLRRTLDATAAACQAVIVRSPSPIAFLVWRSTTLRRRPFAAELVGDPDQVFSAGAFSHPLRMPIRVTAAALQRKLARDATAVLYVTRQVLQRRYPTGGVAYAASDAALDDLAFAAGPPRARRSGEPLVLVTVGALNQPYKGTSVLIEALADLRRRELPVRLRVVGSGPLMGDLQRQADAANVASDVEFLGQRDADGVRQALDSAHLFVLPSLTEGLPRALLEAMARGLPAVATAVGGVPELLPASCLVPPRQASALAARIEDVLRDEDVRQRLGEDNRRRATEYHVRLQAPVRREFLRVVRDASSSRQEARCA
jgi:glycosyltransferase involved in cell wall biosynthesis